MSGMNIITGCILCRRN